MNKIGEYGRYQNQYYENARLKQKETAKEQKTKETKTDKAVKKDSVELSEKAKDLLSELKKKYGNMDFIVADYNSDEEAASYLSRGTKEYSVLIDPDTLEEMAADQETKDKYIGLIDDATAKLSGIKDQLGDRKEEVTRLGVSIGKDGTVSYFAELEKANEKQKERLEKSKEDKLNEKKSEKKTRVTAGSVEELLEKIKSVDWEQIPEEKEEKAGSRIDFCI
ncbi:MAG: DUF6033 family protein [Clostridiales bacterium]|nr:DUF6033 family protein [Clostridiales bacterium]